MRTARNSPKRSRVSRACDQCRASREKCDGSRPKCETCRSQNRECSYNEPPKKRGIQPNYIRTLELTLAWLFKNFPTAEARLAKGLPDENNAFQLIGGKDPEATEVLHLAWRNGIINKQIDQLLSGVPIDRPGQASEEAFTHGESGLPLYSSPPLSAPLENVISEQLASSNGVPMELSPPRGMPSQIFDQLNAVTSQDDRHQLPENAWTLLEYYFAFTHSWLPMTEKHSILKVMYSYPPEGLQYEYIKDAEHAELWAIMALAAIQLSDEQSTDGALRIRKLAESLIPYTMYELPHIKAMILLALTDIQNDQVLAAWLRIGAVVRVLYLFKLLENLGQVAKWCRHIHLVAFVVESALALHLRTYCHLRVSFIKSIGFLDEDGIDEWAPWADPLASSLPTKVNRAPTRAFSTLNELSRIYMRSATDDPTSQDANSPNVFFALLRNAASRQSRLQPSDLVATHSNNQRNEFNDLAVQNQVLEPLWTSQNPMTAPCGVSNPVQNHGFMSIPTDTSGNVLDSSLVTANTTPYSTTSWRPEAPMNSNFEIPTPGTGSVENPTDIFDEFAALERQDSTQHPQFMRNLGFPDLELAEFFGPDYQTSDPLLAYLQPAPFVESQGIVGAEIDHG